MACGTASGLLVLGRPELVAPDSLPGHRILTFDLANRGKRAAEIDVGEFTLRARDGAHLRAVIAFDRESGGPGTKIQAKRAALAPGTVVRVVAVWREGDVVRLDYPGGTVEIDPAAATNEPLA